MRNVVLLSLASVLSACNPEVTFPVDVEGEALTAMRVPDDAREVDDDLAPTPAG